MLRFDIEEPKNNRISLNQSSSEDFTTKIKKLYRDFVTSPTVRTVVNPFHQEDRSAQLCYKIFAGITIFTLLVIIYLIIVYG